MKLYLLLFFSLFLTVVANAQLAGPSSFTSATGNFSQYLSRSHVKTSSDGSEKGGIVDSFNDFVNTKGTRFLFNNWVKGENVIDAQGNKVEASAFLFNFDKMTGSLLVSQNKIDIMSVAPIGVKSFTLLDKNQRYDFSHVKAIDSLRFFLALAVSNDKYSLYKQFKCKFKPSDYFSSGIIESGHNYDEYTDESEYFVVMPGSATSKQVTLKVKNIKEVLSSEKEKVNTYFSQHKADAIDEHFLAGLIDFLNQ